MRQKWIVWTGLIIASALFLLVTVKLLSLKRERTLTQTGGRQTNDERFKLQKNYETRHPNNPIMYMDIRIGNEKIGRIIFELFHDITPKTAENWRQLCLGRTLNGKFYQYKGMIFHRIIKNFVTQGGDIVHRDGTGSISIYGDKFPDENFIVKHKGIGLLSMANAGPDTNGSQFSITCVETPHLDGKHVVFGRVIDGMKTVKIMENSKTGPGDRPLIDVIVDACGQLK
jgi:cyclophilin family peptidyl-prolyl cis-trans isomerase